MATYNDTIYNNIEAVKIHFSTKTNKLISKLFPIDNQYTTIINKKDNSLLSFQKITKQPDLINIITTYENNGEIFYNNNKIINNKMPNIFCLFYMIQNNLIDNNKSLLIEREGITFKLDIDKNIKKDLHIYYINNMTEHKNEYNEPVYKNTDIFTWAVFKPSAKRKIIVDTNKNTILKCEFQFGLSKMTAYIKN